MLTRVRRRVLPQACLVALIALATGRSRGATKEARDLSPVEKIAFSAAPATAMLTETKCDAKGNVYVVESTVPPSLLGPSGLSGIPVLTLSMGSKSTVQHSVPTLDGYRGVLRSDFDVSADGKLYVLLQALDASTESQAPPSSFVGKYADDGSLDSYFKLGDPPRGRLQPFRLAVFRSGNVLVTGTTVNEGDPLRTFVGIFDGSSGRFVSYVNVSDNVIISKSSTARHLPTEHKAAPETPAPTEKAPPEESEAGHAISLSSSCLMASAPDGNVYLLRDAAHPHLYAVSPAGDVVREFDVPAPRPGLAASNIGTAGGSSIFISFGVVHGVSAPSDTADGENAFISVLNTQTGEVTAVYRLPGDADGLNVPACAVSSDNFLLLGSTSDQQRQQVTRYAPRKLL